MEGKRIEEKEDYAFVHYIECSAPRNNGNKVLGNVSLQVCIDKDDGDHILAEISYISEENSLKVWKWMELTRSV